MDYERGLEQLKQYLQGTACEQEFQIYEARLRENLSRERLYGSNEQSRFERAQIVVQLNRLAGQVDTSFNDLCQSHQSEPLIPANAEHEQTQGTAPFPPIVPAPIWNVPYPQNHYFTDRKALLKQLHTAFSRKKTGSAIRHQALNGLGGIGKSQLALEYAYQYFHHYKAIFWVRADSRDTLLADFMRIAHLLHLTKNVQQTQTDFPRHTDSRDDIIRINDLAHLTGVKRQEWSHVIYAAKQWFHDHSAWLLIFDNVNDLTIVNEFIPTLGEGCILITCRMQSLGNLVPHPVEVDTMNTEDGILLLLRRAGILSLEDTLDTVSEQDRMIASTLVKEVDGLPLALDQAGAYIEETGCSLARYLDLYKKHYDRLLKRRGISSAYPQSVATTWSLSFRKIEKANPVAAEMLRLCAFLHPDAIPEDIFTESQADPNSVLSSVADDPIALDEAINALRRYSLVKRNAELRTLTIHRLVQRVLIASMSTEQQHRWAERTISIVNWAFPAVKRMPVDMAQWPSCEQYLPHAQVCLTHIERHALISVEAASLLHHVGCYLYIRGRYAEAQPFCIRALQIREQVLGLEHPDVVQSLELLAGVYHKQGQYAEEEPLFQRIISYQKQTLGPRHPDVAKSLHGLGKLYYRQGRYAEAEPLLQQALSIYGQALGPENANTLSLLGILYWEQGRYAEAEPLLQQALSIFEQALGPTSPEVANALTGLGVVYKAQGKYDEALLLHQRALSIFEKTQGPAHPNVASSLDSIAILYSLQGKYTEAEPSWQRALSIFEQALGPEHPHVGIILNHLADLFIYQEKYTEAEQLLQHALAIHKKSLGDEHRRTINDLYSLGVLYTRQEKYAEAEQFLLQVLALYEKALGPEHPDIAESLISLAELYQKQEKADESRSLLQRALTIQEKVFGPEHPKTLVTNEQYQSLFP